MLALVALVAPGHPMGKGGVCVANEKQQYIKYTPQQLAQVPSPAVADRISEMGGLPTALTGGLVGAAGGALAGLGAGAATGTAAGGALVGAAGGATGGAAAGALSFSGAGAPDTGAGGGGGTANAENSARQSIADARKKLQ